MTVDQTEFETRDLGSSLRRIHLPDLVREISRPCATSLLKLDGYGLSEVSTYGAAGIRSGMEVHLVREPQNRVELIEPNNSECFAHLSDLMGLPVHQRWAWSGTRSTASRGRDVLVPATVIRDNDDAVLIADRALPAAASALGAGGHARHLVQEASAVFLQNARDHARSERTRPVLAASFGPVDGDLQLVCVNLEDDGALPINDVAELREAVMGAYGGAGSINGLVDRSWGGLSFVVRLMAGTGRGILVNGRDPVWLERPAPFPGFAIGLEVQVPR